ncbi:hypothetical protein ABT354_14055 [Streptomyces sp. NPDC000594]|uniref:hypothetical protein n=1 Tax=Streptomyces sp. NPDC000594 TaxID=3154261 RepID=UPI00332A4C59
MRRLAPLLLIPVLVGYSSSPEDVAICTQKGGSSGVTVGWDRDDFPRAATFRVCAGERCEQAEWTAGADMPMDALLVEMDEDIGGITVPVRLTVTSPRGERIVEDSARVRLREDHINGRGCDPVLWTAGLTAHPEKGLVPADGPAERG